SRAHPGEVDVALVVGDVDERGEAHVVIRSRLRGCQLPATRTSRLRGCQLPPTLTSRRASPVGASSCSMTRRGSLVVPEALAAKNRMWRAWNDGADPDSSSLDASTMRATPARFASAKSTSSEPLEINVRVPDDVEATACDANRSRLERSEPGTQSP